LMNAPFLTTTTTGPLHFTTMSVPYVFLMTGLHLPRLPGWSSET